MSLDTQSVSHEGKTLVWHNNAYPKPCITIGIDEIPFGEIVVVEKIEWCPSQEVHDDRESLVELYDDGASHVYLELTEAVYEQLVESKAKDMDKILTLEGWE